LEIDLALIGKILFGAALYALFWYWREQPWLLFGAGVLSLSAALFMVYISVTDPRTNWTSNVLAGFFGAMTVSLFWLSRVHHQRRRALPPDR
jgi:ABC-type uncharacterized transport system permease subunit